MTHSRVKVDSLIVGDGNGLDLGSREVELDAAERHEALENRDCDLGNGVESEAKLSEDGDSAAGKQKRRCQEESLKEEK